ncbi:DUF3024 domain-containing protein [Cohnella thailandensis]|jgi:Protein of unknown function (DUF3024).|uniref:DUF3024 domain-containing protein n=1 Tax=Cohnella thailandensis TaxID=557557 RepID=A0A841SX68_9BACL|nr:DUF3024 domain-containing protein [Cohnella thailandensis]MBB6633341.1 DUF3024 domain-containing protein [Cohnella thailandensis]MBP1977317.1 hypothetical protein [Cohnella thailandensis]
MDAFTVRRIEKILQWYIGQKIPLRMRSSVRLAYEWEGTNLTLCEERPDQRYREWIGLPIVQFRFLQDKWHVYAISKKGTWESPATIKPHEDFERQLELVELDREGIFWTA